MRKMTALIITVVLAFTAAMAGADPFSLREGIQWYMNKEQVQECLQKEPDYGKYNIFDESDFAEYLYQQSPQEKENPKMWCLYVTNVSLGREDESVNLLFGGTKPHGVYIIYYWVIPNDGQEESFYSRAKELQSQLSLKYGKMEVNDQWENRQNIKVNNYIYDSRVKLDDGTSVAVYLINNNGTLELRIEYDCDKFEEIDNAVTDGTIYIEPAYGL